MQAVNWSVLHSVPSSSHAGSSAFKAAHSKVILDSRSHVVDYGQACHVLLSTKWYLRNLGPQDEPSLKAWLLKNNFDKPDQASKNIALCAKAYVVHLALLKVDENYHLNVPTSISSFADLIKLVKYGKPSANRELERVQWESGARKEIRRWYHEQCSITKAGPDDVSSKAKKKQTRKFPGKQAHLQPQPQGITKRQTAPKEKPALKHLGKPSMGKSKPASNATTIDDEAEEEDRVDIECTAKPHDAGVFHSTADGTFQQSDHSTEPPDLSSCPLHIMPPVEVDTIAGSTHTLLTETGTAPVVCVVNNGNLNRDEATEHASKTLMELGHREVVTFEENPNGSYNPIVMAHPGPTLDQAQELQQKDVRQLKADIETLLRHARQTEADANDVRQRLRDAEQEVENLRRVLVSIEGKDGLRQKLTEAQSAQEKLSAQLENLQQECKGLGREHASLDSRPSDTRGKPHTPASCEDPPVRSLVAELALLKACITPQAGNNMQGRLTALLAAVDQVAGSQGHEGAAAQQSLLHEASVRIRRSLKAGIAGVSVDELARSLMHPALLQQSPSPTPGVQVAGLQTLYIPHQQGGVVAPGAAPQVLVVDPAMALPTSAAAAVQLQQPGAGLHMGMQQPPQLAGGLRLQMPQQPVAGLQVAGAGHMVASSGLPAAAVFYPPGPHAVLAGQPGTMASVPFLLQHPGGLVPHPMMPALATSANSSNSTLPLVLLPGAVQQGPQPDSTATAIIKRQEEVGQPLKRPREPSAGPRDPRLRSDDYAWPPPPDEPYPEDAPPPKAPRP